jgi:hypothetical protein
MICAFAPCTCPVEADGDFCLPTCRMGIGGEAEQCKCGHAECTATDGDG